MFVLGCSLRTNMCAYVYPSVRMYLSASCVRVTMLVLVCVHARVSEDVCVSPSVRLSVCPRACSCVQIFDRTSLRSSMHVFVCLHACVREGVCLSPSVRLSVCLSTCMFVRPNVRMRSSIHARHFLFLSSYFLLLTSTSNG